MLATEALAIRPYEPKDDDFVAALAKDAFDEFTPRAVLHTLSMVRRCTTLVALQELRTRTLAVPGGVMRASASSRWRRRRTPRWC
jgi:hypothetical protein